MATTFATLGESAPTTRPVVHKAAYFSLDQDTLCSIPCGCPTHVDPSILAPLPPRRRPAIKTTLPSNTVSPPPPAKRRVDPSSPLQPQLAHKRTRTSRSELKETGVATCHHHVSNSQPPDQHASEKNTAAAAAAAASPTAKDDEKDDNSHKQWGRTAGHDNAKENEGGHRYASDKVASASTTPLRSFTSLSAQCRQLLSPIASSPTSLATDPVTRMPVDKQERNHEEEQEEDDDEKSKDQVEEAILGLIEDSMLVIDLRFLINDTPVDLQENALSRGHIVNGIFSPEFWKPYCVSTVEDLGFHRVDGPCGEPCGATSRQAVLHFCSNSIPSSNTGASSLSSLIDSTTTTMPHAAKNMRRSTSVLSLLGLQLSFGWTTDTPDLLRQRLSQSYWSPLICPERLAVTTAMHILAKDVLEKDYPLVFCAKEIKKAEAMLSSVAVLASSMTRIVQNSVSPTAKHRMQMSIKTLESRHGLNKGTSLHQLVVMALESAILSSMAARSLRSPRPSRLSNLTRKAKDNTRKMTNTVRATTATTPSDQATGLAQVSLPAAAVEPTMHAGSLSRPPRPLTQTISLSLLSRASSSLSSSPSLTQHNQAH